jgi:indolepyruvate ferredoxin oxidoreductase beta subunit
MRSFDAVMRAWDERAGRIDAAAVRELRDAALADEHGRALEAALARLAPAQPADVRAQPALAGRS